MARPSHSVPACTRTPEIQFEAFASRRRANRRSRRGEIRVARLSSTAGSFAGLLIALCATAVAFQLPVKITRSSKVDHHGPEHDDLLASEDQHTHDHKHEAVLGEHTHDGSTHVHNHLHEAVHGVHTHDGSTHTHAADDHLHEAVLGKHTHDGSTHTHAADMHTHDHLHLGATGKHTHGGTTHVHAADEHSHVPRECTVVFDAEGSYCLEDRDYRPVAPMSRADALACLATDECEIPEQYADLLEVKSTNAKPSLQVFDSEGSQVRAR